MDTLTLIIIGFVILCIVIGYIAWLVSGKRKLSTSSQAQVRQAWKRVESTKDAHLQILEADKVLDLALKLLGFEGSLGDKLKAAGPRFSDVNSVWYAHKLRNRIAHEVHVQLTQAETEKAMRIFKRALRELGA